MEFYDQKIDDIIYCYAVWSPDFEDLKSKCRFVQGVIDPDELDPTIPHLVILDDLSDSIDDRVVSIFTRGAHHRQISVILITQNLFNQTKGFRTIALNSQYQALFRSPRDVSQIRVLEQQMFPGKKNFLVESYNDACSKPYQCLFLDLKPQTPEHLRVRGRIFDPNGQDVYVPKSFKWTDELNN